MTFSIRVRLTLWYAVVVFLIVILMGMGVFFGASWGLRRAADMELTSGIDGVATFLRHKLDIHEMNNLNEELREHSALLPRGKMFRVSHADGSVVYQPDAMAIVTPSQPSPNQTLWQNIRVGHRSFRSISRWATVGSYIFLIQVAVDQTEYAELTKHLAWLLLFTIPATTLLAGFGGYWMSGRALAPIHQITKTTNSIDAENLTRRLPLLGTNDELDRLSKTINLMLDRIAAAYERIAQFTADASHELRTPVALIRSNAELLLMDLSDKQRTRQGLADILGESEYMARLIGDLLTLARLGQGDGSFNMELFELAESIDTILPRAQSLAATKNIAFEYISDNHVLPVFGNRAALERILMIFVDNAVRYTHVGGQISLISWVGDARCGFTIRDNGIGISPSDQEHLFERFFRVDIARTPRDGGSGLGLSIAKSLVDLHAGTIKIDSDIGRGTSFEIALPRGDMASQSLKDERLAAIAHT
jgi:signal transduction histidine kinase